jgi:translation initiation factor 5A
MSDMDEFASGAGAALTTPLAAGQLRKNGYVVMKGFPCKIVDMSTSKTGKHGHAKINMTGLDIFTGKKYEDLSPSTHNMEVPVVKRTEWSLMDITDDGFASLMSMDGSETKEDLSIPDGELGDKIRAAFDEGKEVIVQVTAAMEKEAILGWKEGQDES